MTVTVIPRSTNKNSNDNNYSRKLMQPPPHLISKKKNLDLSTGRYRTNYIMNRWYNVILCVVLMTLTPVYIICCHGVFSILLSDYKYYYYYSYMCAAYSLPCPTAPYAVYYNIIDIVKNNESKSALCLQKRHELNT